MMKVEINKKFMPTDADLGKIAGGMILMTPNVGDEEYWLFKVHLYEDQAIIGFPKFTTIGVGFLIEDDDWNTNLPYSCDANGIYNHIENNKKYSQITKEKCLIAIKLIQKACKTYESVWKETN